MREAELINRLLMEGYIHSNKQKKHSDGEVYTELRYIYMGEDHILHRYRTRYAIPRYEYEYRGTRVVHRLTGGADAAD